MSDQQLQAAVAGAEEVDFIYTTPSMSHKYTLGMADFLAQIAQTEIYEDRTVETVGGRKVVTVST